MINDFLRRPPGRRFNIQPFQDQNRAKVAQDSAQKLIFLKSDGPMERLDQICLFIVTSKNGALTPSLLIPGLTLKFSITLSRRFITLIYVQANAEVKYFDEFIKVTLNTLRRGSKRVQSILEEIKLAPKMARSWPYSKSQNGIFIWYFTRRNRNFRW